MPEELVPTDVEQCSHDWLIERPSGETSKGVCKFFGAVRDFVNHEVRLTFQGAKKSGLPRGS